MGRPFRNSWQRLSGTREGGNRRDFTRFAAILGLFSLIAAVALVAVLIASLVGGDSDDLPPPFESPSPTAPAGSPEPTTSAAPTSTPEPTDGTGGLVPPPPGDVLSLGFWANELDAWWFGDLPEGAAVYREGDEVPFMLRWAATPGNTYEVRITYQCASGGAPAIDILTGVEYAHAGIFEAEWGPGSTLPDAAVPVPDTPDLALDDAAPGLLYLYGGEFTLLPSGPDPACEGSRTIRMSMQAAAEEMILMGSAWLAQGEDHGGIGAAEAGPVFMQGSVTGVGEAIVGLDEAVIVP
jgi:hypothetical protein